MEHSITKEEVEKGLEKNHIPYSNSAANGIKIYDFSNLTDQHEIIVHIKDNKITSIFEILEDDDIKLYYGHECSKMYQMFCITLKELAKENCEINYNSLKNTIESLSNFENIDYGYVLMDDKILLKAGVGQDCRWQFCAELKFLDENTVMINYIKDYARDLFIYGDNNEF
jgi:hypothetical protein